VDRYVGIDLGTSALKVAVVARDGSVLDGAAVSYPVYSPKPGWAEASPADWHAALGFALDAVGAAAAGARAVGIAGQMHGAVLCNAAGDALRPAVLWPDRRAVTQIEQWQRLPEEIRARLANPVVPGMTGPILRWLLENEPNLTTRASVVLLPKDCLRVAIGGTPVTDRSDASATLLWDLPADAWSMSTLDSVGIPTRLLPSVRESSAGDGQVTLAGVLNGVPLVVGCADTAAALLASRLRPGEVQINLGTGIQVLRTVAEPWAQADPPVHLYAAADEGWYAMVAVQNGGLALDWVRQLFTLTWPELFARADKSSAEGVAFLPFLTGERGGVAPPSARGAWVGMSERTTRDTLIRSAVEGVAFCVRRAVELLGAWGQPARLSGGGARSPVLRQLLADVLEMPLTYVEARSASAVGAAMLAARGVGERIEPAPPAADLVEPRPSPALADAYRTWLNMQGHLFNASRGKGAPS